MTMCHAFGTAFISSLAIIPHGLLSFTFVFGDLCFLLISFLFPIHRNRDALLFFRVRPFLLCR